MKTKIRQWASILAILIAAAGSASAATLTWGPTGSGGAGTWDGVTSNWYNGASVTWSDGSDAFFRGTAGVVTVTGTRAIGGLSNDVAGYTLSGGTLSLSGAATPFSLPSAMTISSIISGSGGILKTGAGNLTLSVANTFTGSTSIQGGRVIASNNSALGTGASGVSIGSTGTLELSNVTIAKNIAFNAIGARIFMGSGTSTITGDVSINADASKFQLGSTTLNLNGSVTADAYVILSPVVTDGIIRFNGVFTQGVGKVTDHEGVGQVIFAAAGNVVREMRIRQGSVLTDVAGALASSSVLRMGGETVFNSTATAKLDLKGNNQEVARIYEVAGILNTTLITSSTQATLTIGGTGGNSALTGSITGAIDIVKNGAAVFTLGGTNTYTGDTVVNAGQFDLASTGALTFYATATGVNNQLSGAGTLDLDGKFIFDLSGASTVFGASWDIIDGASLANTTYGGTFSVQGFAGVAGVWTSGNYQFTEATGVLQVVPEPSVAGLLIGGLAFVVLLRVRRREGIDRAIQL